MAEGVVRVHHLVNVATKAIVQAQYIATSLNLAYNKAFKRDSKRVAFAV